MAVLKIDPYAELVKALTGEDLRSLPDEVEALCSGGLGDSFVVDDQYEDDVLEWASAHSVVCEHDGKDWRYTGEPEVVCRECFVLACRSWLLTYLPEHIEPDCADGSVSEDELQRVAAIVVALGTGVISREVLLLDMDGRSRALDALGFGTGWMSGYINEARFDNETTARLFSALAWFDEVFLSKSLSSWYVTVKDPSVHYPLRLPTSETSLSDAPKVYSFLESSSDDDVSDQGGAA